MDFTNPMVLLQDMVIAAVLCDYVERTLSQWVLLNRTLVVAKTKPRFCPAGIHCLDDVPCDTPGVWSLLRAGTLRAGTPLLVLDYQQGRGRMVHAARVNVI